MAAKTASASEEMPAAPAKQVLVIDANEDHQTLSALALGRRGFKVTTADSGKEGLRLALTSAFDAIVLDSKLRDTPAFEVLHTLVVRLPRTPKIFVVPAGAEDQAVKAVSLGATGHLVKTARYNEVLPMEVEEQIDSARTRARLEEQTRAMAKGLVEREQIEASLRDFEARIGLMCEQAPFILWTLDPDLKFTSFVGSGLKGLGLLPNQVEGRSLVELMDVQGSGEVLVTSVRRALAGESVRFEQEWQGRVFDVHVEPLRTKGGPVLGLFGVALDVTERVRSERIQSALYHISQSAATAENLQELFRSIHETVGGLMPAKNFYIALHDTERNMLDFPYFVDEEEAPPGPQPLDRGLTEYVLRTGQPLLADPQIFDALLRAGEVEQIGPNSIDWLGVPLIVKDRVFGVLVVQSYTEGVRYHESDRDLLKFVCSQIAMVIDRKRTEETLRESQRLLSTLVGSLPGVAYRVKNDKQWTNEFVSEGCQDILGYRTEDLLGNRKLSGRDLIHPDDRHWVDEQTEAAIRDRRAYRLGYRIRTAGGEEKWVWDQGHAVYDADGNVVALEGLVTDVTEWKSVADGLRTRGTYRALFDSASDAILVVDRDGLIMEANPMAEALLAKAHRELLRKPLAEFLETAEEEPLALHLESLFTDPSREASFDTTLRTEGGVPRPLRAQARVVQDVGTMPVVEIKIRDADREGVTAEPVPRERSAAG